MSQKEPSAEALMAAFVHLGGDPEREGGPQRTVATERLAHTLDAFAAQAVAVRAREPDVAIDDAVWRLKRLAERYSQLSSIEYDKQQREILMALAAIGPGRSDRDATPNPARAAINGLEVSDYGQSSVGGEPRIL